jgi:hypothetical protein
MKDIIKGVMEFILGVALLPTAGAFVAYVVADENLTGILGFTLIMTVGLVILSFGIIIHAYRSIVGE